MDVSDPFLPFIAGSADTPGDALSVALRESFAFIADDASGLTVVDVSDPGAPAVVSTIDTPGLAADVALSRSYAWVADWTSGLQVIDISDPATPQIVASAPTIDQASAVVATAEHAFVADDDGGLVILPAHCAAPSRAFEPDGPPEALRLRCYPDPARAGTTICYDVARPGPVCVRIYALS